MNKLRSALATVVLIAALSGLSLLQGLGSVANAASSRHVSSASSTLVVGKSTAISARPNWPCPSGTNDC